MAISFNNIPDSLRTPGAYVEIDNSRALKGLVQNPHKVLLIGQKYGISGTASQLELKAITNDGLADGFFGAGSILARMCNRFKAINPNTELYAIAASIAAAGAAASGNINVTGSATTDGTVYLLLNGDKVYTPITSGWSGTDVVSAVKSDINANAMSRLAMRASTGVSADRLLIIAKASCDLGNQFDFRLNYYEGQSNPKGITFSVTAMAGGSTNPDIGDVWAVIGDEQFHHIVNPYNDDTNMDEIESELADRFGPMVDLQGFGYTAYRGAAASCTTYGNARNSPHTLVMGLYDSPHNPEDWATAVAAVSSGVLEIDPARPVQYLTLKGILPPPIDSRFTQSERNTLLYDGVSTFIVDTGGNVMIERLITTYQTNALGLPDPSYLNVETLFTLMEIRFQYKVRMVNRFIIPRFKIADDTFVVQAGQKVATPKTVKSEIIALFTLLYNNGLVENIDDFIENLVVERSDSDVDRMNVLLPPDLINQFRILATQLQFIL